MKGNITITLFEIEKIEPLINWINKEIVYDKCTIGLHVDSNREHIHIGMVNVDLPKVRDVRKYYNRKGVKEIIETAKNLKFSVYAEGDKDKDDMKCLAYPLKEYENTEEIKYREYIKGIEEDELENLRAYAHTRYLAIKHNRDRKNQVQEETQTRQLTLEKYLLDHFWSEMMGNTTKEQPVPELVEKYQNMTIAYLELFQTACKFNADVEEKLSWRWNDIANHVISFMFRQKEWDNYKIIMFQQKIKY